MRGNPTQAGDKVRFLVSDIFLPGRDALVVAPPGQTELEGTIVNFSDSGQKEQFFALVEIVKTQSVVIAVDKLVTIPQPGSNCGP
jgi:hypothetical protein